MGNVRYKNGSKRRELRKSLLRTQSTCALCGKPIDKTLHYLNPMAPEVDEIVPVSRGGDPLDRRNLQLVHRICNPRRGNKPMKEVLGQPRVKDLPIPKSREW